MSERQAGIRFCPTSLPALSWMRRRGLRNVRGRCRAARPGARPRRARATAFEPAPSSFRPQARALAKSVGARQLRCSPYRAAPEAGMSGAADASAPCHGQGGARRKPRSARMRGAVHAWVPLGVERALSGSARTHARRAPFCPATRQAQGGNCVPEWRGRGGGGGFGEGRRARKFGPLRRDRVGATDQR